MKKLMIVAAVLAAIAVAPAFAQTKSAPLDPHTLPQGPDHQMGPALKPAMGGKNVPVDTHALPNPEHQMGPATTPAMGGKNIPVDTHALPNPEHIMPPSSSAK
ncbi:MAG: hypothetical protein EPN26_13730 [Rhodospirillales bacterium]|nr:MAG: hypothetical protein EPN26_13730 [Rhodospirillales bacterium]